MSLEKLGETIARAQDPQLPGHIEHARARLLGAAPVRPRRAVLRPLVLAVAAGLVAVLGVRWWITDAPEAITFEVGTRAGVPHELIQAPAGGDVAVRFSDETTVLFTPQTRGAVEHVTARGADVRIDRGRVAVSMPPQHGARWTFEVGPFALEVAGTRFDAAWDERVFELVVHAGSLEVAGPTIVGTRVVVAGEVLRVAVVRTVDTLVPAAEVRDAGAIVTAVEPEPRTPPHVEPGVAAPPLHAPRIAAPASSSWRALSADGQYAAALAAVGGKFDELCATASATEVTALGDTSRLAGDRARAQRAYLAVRRRFAGPAAGDATFALARLAFEAPDDELAIRWLEAYLHEDPQAPLAREALGRLLEVLVRTHQGSRAATIAATYLERYPEGPHARLARSVGAP